MLTELNEAILELVHRLNDRPFRKLAGSRAELYRLERKYGAERLEAASTRADGSLDRLLESIARTDVLLVDDFRHGSVERRRAPRLPGGLR